MDNHPGAAVLQDMLRQTDEEDRMLVNAMSAKEAVAALLEVADAIQAQRTGRRVSADQLRYLAANSEAQAKEFLCVAAEREAEERALAS